MQDTYKLLKNRLSKEEQEGLNTLLARLREKREQATKAQPELRDDKPQRPAQE